MTIAITRLLRTLDIAFACPPLRVTPTGCSKAAMVGLSWILPTLSLVMLALSGCAIHPPVHADLSSRLLQVKTVAVSPPYVVGYVQPYDLSHTRRISLPDVATSNIVLAVHQQFGRQGLFVLRDLDLRASLLAPPTPPWSVCTNSGQDAAGYGPRLYRPEGMHFRPEAFTTPAPETGADAALFTFAWEKTKTAGAIEKSVNPLVVWLLPGALLADQVRVGDPTSSFRNSVTRSEVCLGICIIDCRTGEVLWSDIETAYGLAELKDPETAKTLLCKAYKKLGEHIKAASDK